MRIAEQRRTRYGRHPGCEENLQIKKTGSSGLEKKDRRYMADMDCGGGRHLPQETPDMMIQAVPIMRGRNIRIR